MFTQRKDKMTKMTTRIIEWMEQLIAETETSEDRNSDAIPSD